MRLLDSVNDTEALASAVAGARGSLRKIVLHERKL
jgi:hypothetical protein